jgi:hypothetical protein
MMTFGVRRDRTPVRIGELQSENLFTTLSLRERSAPRADAEGATAPETLRQMNQAIAEKTLESGM